MLQNHFWVKLLLKQQDRPKGFTVKKFFSVVWDSTVWLTFKETTTSQFGGVVKEEIHSSLKSLLKLTPVSNYMSVWRQTFFMHSNQNNVFAPDWMQNPDVFY